MATETFKDFINRENPDLYNEVKAIPLSKIMEEIKEQEPERYNEIESEVKIRANIFRVNRLKEIKEQMSLLSAEKDEIEKNLDDLVIFQNEDKTWTRFTRTDNLKELEEKGTVFRAAPINRYTTKLETLKNEPKENK